MNRRALRRLAQVATAASAVLILYATLSSEPPHLRAEPQRATTAPAPAAAPSVWTAAGEAAAGHIALFAAMGVSAALWYATSDRARLAPRRTLLMAMLALWLFGGLTELAQGLTSTRTASMADLGFDVLGAFTGFLAGGAAWRLLLTRVAR